MPQDTGYSAAVSGTPTGAVSIADTSSRAVSQRGVERDNKTYEKSHTDVTYVYGISYVYSNSIIESTNSREDPPPTKVACSCSLEMGCG